MRRSALLLLLRADRLIARIVFFRGGPRVPLRFHDDGDRCLLPGDACARRHW